MTDVLSSDILEQQFGATEIEVLHQDEQVRIIATYAKGSGRILELSRVIFKNEGIAAFPDTHRSVLAGESIGKAFRKAQIPFGRKVSGVYRQTLSGSFNQRFKSSKPAIVVPVSILVGSDKLPYAEIIETYTPELVWPPQGPGLPRPAVPDEEVGFRGDRSGFVMKASSQTTQPPSRGPAPGRPAG